MATTSLRLALTRPLDAPWRAVIDDVLASRGLPASSEVARLAPRVAALSRTYNAGEAGAASRDVSNGRLRAEDLLDARLAFSFARDVPKGAAAVRELVSAGALALREGAPLRIVDVGAGLGAMTWGIVRALAAAGGRGHVDALLVDGDARALALAEQIAGAAHRHRGAVPDGVSLSITTRVERLSAAAPRVGPADLVVVGQVLSELDVGEDAAVRVERHAALVDDLLRTTVAPGGSLVVVEPALRDRTRHLHAVRDRVLATANGAVVFGPCLHAEACPALRDETDWCHDDLEVDLPEWLVPLARAAGLRFQGLTFSHLVLRRDGDRLVSRMSSGGLRLRVVSQRMHTKGKTEAFVCTERGERLRLRRLERDERAAPSGFDELERGDVVTLTGSLEGSRLARDVAIDVWPSRK